MRIEVEQVTSWGRVVNAARVTVGKEVKETRIVTSRFKHRLLRAEHSPIRLLEFDIRVYDVPYWVVMHLVRHHIGIEKFVSTQRSDRTFVSRDTLPQNSLVNAQFSLNAQALINISRVRLCRKASKETRELWEAIKAAIAEKDGILAQYMVPNCIYRGHCPEIDSCGWNLTVAGFQELAKYPVTKGNL